MSKSNNDVNPLISIIMGIYNCEDTLQESIDSIIKQTFTNWELILCDDGSTDKTLEIANTYSTIDKRINVIKNKNNMGLTYSLNKCLSASKGTYIARHDGDDISNPERFSKQLELLNRHKNEINFVSTAICFFNDKGLWGKTTPEKFPETKDFIKASPFAHAAVLIEKSALVTVNGYRDLYWTNRVEDYDLWFRLYHAGFKGANLEETLYEVRDDLNAFKRRKFKFRINEMIVRINGYKMLNVSKIHYIYALRPILTFFIPRVMYDKLRKIMY